MAASAGDVLAEFLAGALGSVTTKVVIFPLETSRVILAVSKSDMAVPSARNSGFDKTTKLFGAWLSA